MCDQRSEAAQEVDALLLNEEMLVVYALGKHQIDGVQTGECDHWDSAAMLVEFPPVSTVGRSFAGVCWRHFLRMAALVIHRIEFVARLKCVIAPVQRQHSALLSHTPLGERQVVDLGHE